MGQASPSASTYKTQKKTSKRGLQFEMPGKKLHMPCSLKFVQVTKRYAQGLTLK